MGQVAVYFYRTAALQLLGHGAEYFTQLAYARGGVAFGKIGGLGGVGAQAGQERRNDAHIERTAAKMSFQGLHVDNQLVESGVVSLFEVFNPALKLVVKTGALGFFAEVTGEQFDGAVEVHLVLNFCLFHEWVLVMCDQ